MTPEAGKIKQLWRDGNLEYRFRNSQKAIKAAWLESRMISHKFYIESTRRLGKSSYGLLLLSEECIKNPNSRWGFFAPVKDGLLDYIEPIIRRTYEDCPEQYKPHFNTNRFILTFKNGSSIIFRGANNKTHRTKRGLDLNGAFIDEGRDIAELDELIESVIMPTLFSSAGWLIISSTPADSKNHPLYRYRQLAEVEKWMFRCPIQTAHEYDPDVFTQEKIEAWKKETLDEDRWKREYNCEWIISTNLAAVKEWDSTKFCQTLPRDPFYNFYHHYIGIDWGYKDYTAVVFGTWDFRKARLVVESELTFSGNEVRSDIISAAISLQILKTWGEDATVYRMVSDSADPILINELNNHTGMSFIPVHKERSLEAMLNQFRVFVAREQIIISPKCAMTLSSVSNAVWTENRDKLDSDPFHHHFDHLMALVYLTRIIDLNTNPIPPNTCIDGTRVIDLNFDKHPGASTAASVISDAYTAARKKNQ